MNTTDEMLKMIELHKKRAELAQAMDDAGLQLTLWSLGDYLSMNQAMFYDASLTPLNREHEMTNEAMAMAIKKILR